MAGLFQRDSRDGRNFVLRSATSFAAPVFSAEVGVIQLDLSPQQIDLLPFTHRPQDRAGRERGLMAATAALKTLERPAVDEPMRLTISA